MLDILTHLLAFLLGVLICVEVVWMVVVRDEK